MVSRHRMAPRLAQQELFETPLGEGFLDPFLAIGWLFRLVQQELFETPLGELDWPY